MTMTALRHPSILPNDVGDRALAIARGDLVDVTAEAARLRFRHPVAVTREVWEDCCHWDEVIEARKTGYSAQETEGRVRDLLWLALVAARRSKARVTYFTVDRVPTTGRGTQARSATLTMTIGPGDELEPVITIAFPPSH